MLPKHNMLLRGLRILTIALVVTTMFFVVVFTCTPRWMVGPEKSAITQQLADTTTKKMQQLADTTTTASPTTASPTTASPTTASPTTVAPTTSSKKIAFTSQGGNSVSAYLYNTLMRGQQDKQGTFVEFGCADGVKHSNTFPFEKQMGWKGLCIEPNYENYLKAADVRDNAIFALVTGKPGNFTYAQMSGECDGLSGIIEFYSPQYKMLMAKCEAKGLLKRVPLEGIPLGTLLAKHNFTQVDWISVDCEGCEASFITNFNFTKWGVQMVNYEPNTAARMHTAEIDTAFKQHGFVFDQQLQDVIWRKPGPFNLV